MILLTNMIESYTSDVRNLFLLYGRACIRRTSTMTGDPSHLVVLVFITPRTALSTVDAEMAERHDAKAVLQIARELVLQIQTLIDNR